jgi:hypothetical protein
MFSKDCIRCEVVTAPALAPASVPVLVQEAMVDKAAADV